MTRTKLTGAPADGRLNLHPAAVCAISSLFSLFFSVSTSSDTTSADTRSEDVVSADFVSAMTATQTTAEPLVIAHRGASGLRPEHTLAAYQLAIDQGADFIEPDVVATSDGVLIVRHENALAMVAIDESGAVRRDASGELVISEATTNVADLAEYASRLTVKRVDGRLMAGWFSEDFSLEEIRTLRARERIPGLRPLSRSYDDVYPIATLSEVIKLVQSHNATAQRAVGLYIETKHPTYFAAEGRHLDGSLIGIDLGMRVLDALLAAGFTDPPRVFIQSFEIAGLIGLRERLDRQSLALPLVQLFGDVFNRRYRAQPYDVVFNARQGADLESIYGELVTRVRGGLNGDTSYADLTTPDVLSYMARDYASAIGPPKDSLMLVVEAPVALDSDGDGRSTQRQLLTGEPSHLLIAAQAAGLSVHAYTLRAEEPFLVRDGERVLDVEEEVARLLELGVRGFFIDQPAQGRRAVDKYRQRSAHSATPASETAADPHSNHHPSGGPS